MSNGKNKNDPWKLLSIEEYKKLPKAKQRKYEEELKKRYYAEKDSAKRGEYSDAFWLISLSKTPQEKIEEADDPINHQGSPGYVTALKYAGAGAAALQAGIGAYNAAGSFVNDYIDDELDKLREARLQEKCLFDADGNPLTPTQKCDTNADCPGGAKCKDGKCEPKCTGPLAKLEDIDEAWWQKIDDWIEQTYDSLDDPMPTLSGCVAPYAKHFFNYVPIHYYLMQKMKGLLDDMLGLDVAKEEINKMIKAQTSCKTAAGDNDFEFDYDAFKDKAEWPQFDLGLFPLSPLPYFKIRIPNWLLLLADPLLVVRRIIIDTVCYALCQLLNKLMLEIAELLIKKQQEELEEYELATGVSSVKAPSDLTKVDLNPFITDESLLKAYELGLVQNKDIETMRKYITESIMNNNKDKDGNLLITMRDIIDLLAGSAGCRAMGEMIKVGKRTHNQSLGLKEEKTIKPFWAFLGDHVDIFAYLKQSQADCEPYICPPEYDEELLDKYKEGISGICALLQKPENLLGDIDPEKLAIDIANSIFKDQGMDSKLDKCNPSLLFGDDDFKKEVLFRRCQKIPLEKYNSPKKNTSAGLDVYKDWNKTSPAFENCKGKNKGECTGVPDIFDPLNWDSINPDDVFAHTGLWETGTKTADKKKKRWRKFYFDGDEDDYYLVKYEDWHKKQYGIKPLNNNPYYGKERWPGPVGEPKGSCKVDSDCSGHKTGKMPPGCGGNFPSTKCEKGKCQSYGWMGWAKPKPKSGAKFWSSWAIPLYLTVPGISWTWGPWVVNYTVDVPLIPTFTIGPWTIMSKKTFKIGPQPLFTFGTVGNGIWFYNGDCDN